MKAFTILFLSLLSIWCNGQILVNKEHVNNNPNYKDRMSNNAIIIENAGTLTDPRDGKVYKLIKIGKQVIMAENLAFKVKDGYWAYNNNEKNVSSLGYLYDWDTAKKVAKGLKGWHLPSDKEWKQLVNYLGGENKAGGKMKETGTLNWNEPNGNASNKSGFNALPAGYYSPVIKFANIGKYANFWSRTRHGKENACKLTLNYKNSKADCSFEPWYYGFSVRLFKNQMFNQYFGNLYKK